VLVAYSHVGLHSSVLQKGIHNKIKLYLLQISSVSPKKKTLKLQRK
jgi:hypothetical protein